MSTKQKRFKYVVVRNKSYGRILKNTKIYFEGKRPKQLKKDGSISFGKNLLEFFRSHFQRFQWIITEEENSIRKERGIYRIRTSVNILSKMYAQLFDETRDVKNDIIKSRFSAMFPRYFRRDFRKVYVAGTLTRLLTKGIIPKLSAEDKQTMLGFIPDLVASESISSVNLVKAETQIKSLKELADDLEKSIKENHTEGDYFGRQYFAICLAKGKR